MAQQLIPIFLKELEQESKTTKKMLQLIPEDKYDWQPHPKSMSFRTLGTHIAELPGWIKMTLTTEELDFAKNEYKPHRINNSKELIDFFEQNITEGKSALIPSNEDKLSEKWVLRNGAHIIDEMTKAEVIRVALNQVVHHRAQLGVFLRLNDIPIPGSYGPSADEH